MSRPTAGRNLLTLLDRPIAFHRSFVRLTGTVNAALMLSQAVYWANRTSDPEGWWWKTQDDWTEETGLTRREQENSRTSLRSAELLEEKKAGLPSKLYYRVRMDVLEALLNSLDVSDCTKPPNLSARNRQTCLHETAKLDCTKPPTINKETETTTETTPEIKEREDFSSAPDNFHVAETSLSENTSIPSQYIPAQISEQKPFSDSPYQRERYKDWVNNHWASLQQEYLPYFQNNSELLRWSLSKCIAWSWDNADKARKFSNPGMRIRKWLDEEDVDRLIRAMEGQGRASQRVAAAEQAGSEPGIGSDSTHDLDGEDLEGLTAHYHKIFGLFRDFAKDIFNREFTDLDWEKLQEDIRDNPTKYADNPSHDGFVVMYEFFGIKTESHDHVIL